jgi:hypothetical protein
MENLSRLVKSLSTEDRAMLENHLSNLTPEEERQTYNKIKEYIKNRLT